MEKELAKDPKELTNIVGAKNASYWKESMSERHACSPERTNVVVALICQVNE